MTALPGLMKHRILAASFLLLALTGCATKKATFQMGYADVTNRVAQMHPSARTKRLPIAVRINGKEVAPGKIYVLKLFEDGDRKFGPRTQVRVTDIGGNATRVELVTRRHSLLFNRSRRACFIEWRRWRELKRILNTT